MTPCKLVYSRHFKCTMNLRRGVISHRTKIFSNTDVRTSGLANKLESEVKQRIFSIFLIAVWMRIPRYLIPMWEWIGLQMGRAVYRALMTKFNLDPAKISKRLTGTLHDSQRSSRLQKALVSRDLNSGKVLQTSWCIVNYIKCRPWKTKMFDRLCKEMGPENTSIFIFTVHQDGYLRRTLLHVFSHGEVKFASTEQGK